MSDNDRVLLGRIGAAHGLKGEVRLLSYTDDPQAIAGYGPLEDETGARSFTIAALRPVKDGLVARLEGVSDRTTAEALNGVDLYAPRTRLPSPRSDEWYHADLVGLVAMSAEGAALGQVVSVQNYGAGDLLEVRPATGGKTVLVPFTQDVVPEVDVEAGWLLMLPPEGTFD